MWPQQQRTFLIYLNSVFIENWIEQIFNVSSRQQMTLLHTTHRTVCSILYTFSFRFYIGCVNNNNALTAVLADNRQEIINVTNRNN